jgi:predicted enzyme related to lactoylglutathione lyase
MPARTTTKAKTSKKPMKPAVRKPTVSNAKPAAKRAPAKKPAAPAAAKKMTAPTAPAAPAPVWVWHECVTSDVVGAKSFYAGVLGWEAYDVQMPTGPYTLFKKDGKDVAGCMTIPVIDGKAVCPTNWCSYVGVADVDATAKKATELGGKIVGGPMDVPGIGRFAVITDPQGASFAVFRPSM